MSLEYRVGDVFDRLAEIGDGTIDLIVTSPPFLALRSYLPADHPDKHKEIGSEATPAQNVGRHAIGIDLDETNADLARNRVGMFMEIDA